MNNKDLRIDDLVMVTLDTPDAKKGDIGFIRDISNEKVMLRKENADNEICIGIEVLERIDYPF